MSGSFRTRLRYLVLVITTIAIGLAVHWSPAALNPDARDVLGDALWAAMMVWIVSVVAPAARLAARSAAALAICFAVELSQLYHAPALDALRETTAGHLVLGSGFDPRDLIAYAAGVCAAALVDRMWLARRRRVA
jgi:hypothetical protein